MLILKASWSKVAIPASPWNSVMPEVRSQRSKRALAAAISRGLGLEPAGEDRIEEPAEGGAQREVQPPRHRGPLWVVMADEGRLETCQPGTGGEMSMRESPVRTSR